MRKASNTVNNPFKKDPSRQPSAQEEIARTYLKLSERTGSRKKTSRNLPWIIAAAAVLMAALAISLRSNIDINIRILGEIPSIAAKAPDRFTTAKEKGIFLVKGSDVNKYHITRTVFEGDALKYSRADKDNIVLSNSRGSGWASYLIELKAAVNLNRLDLRYTARGERGGEFLVIVIVDANNRSYRLEKDISAKLSQDWQEYTINFKPIRSSVDLANISEIRFEFGSLTAGNYAMATAYLKDICLIKTRRMSWL